MKATRILTAALTLAVGGLLATTQAHAGDGPHRKGFPGPIPRRPYVGGFNSGFNAGFNAGFNTALRPRVGVYGFGTRNMVPPCYCGPNPYFYGSRRYCPRHFSFHTSYGW